MFTFPGQREGEDVILVIRKHPVVYCRIVMVFVLTIVFPLFLFLWFWFNQYPFSEFADRGMTVGIFSSLYLIFGILFSCVGWLNEAFDLFILTNERLMDITQTSLFHRSVTSTPLERIQDATSRVNGFLATLLHYGDIDIQTASGDIGLIHLDRVPNAGEIAKAIMNAVQVRKTTSQSGPPDRTAVQDGTGGGV